MRTSVQVQIYTARVATDWALVISLTGGPNSKPPAQPRQQNSRSIQNKSVAGSPPVWRKLVACADPPRVIEGDRTFSVP